MKNLFFALSWISFGMAIAFMLLAVIITSFIPLLFAGLGMINFAAFWFLYRWEKLNE